MKPSTELIIIMLYKFQLNHDVETTTININRAKDRQVVSRTTAFRWFNNFRDNTELNNRSRIGRPREVDREAVIDSIDYCEWKAEDIEVIGRRHLAKDQFKRLRQIFAIAKWCWSVVGTVKDLSFTVNEKQKTSK